MPITDPIKKQIAVHSLLFMKICRSCGARNPINATKCRRCRSKRLRFKKREIGK
ncbi:MAG: 50S ribosomal protein L40e [Candidatus Helarchaeota archaeon]|nr:50S ribosomal protein L40e [Candidatus Helarchaeota archaeon]NVM56122.1 50S ribosomal protein L40e [Candidatus Helarchaeota archaeon]